MPKETNKEKAFSALLKSASIPEAAKQSGLSEKTLRRYLEESEFQKEFKAARRVILEQNITRLQSLHQGAVDTLERNLNCENPSVEVRAAQIIIDGNRKDFETLGILERLEAIENAAEKQNQENGKSILSDGNDKQVNWDFSRTTDAQLLRLKELLSSGNERDAAIYSRQLIDDGFLSQVN